MAKRTAKKTPLSSTDKPAFHFEAFGIHQAFQTRSLGSQPQSNAHSLFNGHDSDGRDAADRSSNLPSRARGASSSLKLSDRLDL